MTTKLVANGSPGSVPALQLIHQATSTSTSLSLMLQFVCLQKSGCHLNPFLLVVLTMDVENKLFNPSSVVQVTFSCLQAEIVSLVSLG